MIFMHMQLGCLRLMNFNTIPDEQREYSFVVVVIVFCVCVSRKCFLARVNPDL